MTVPSYTEDLTDATLAEESTGWVELTGTDQDSETYNACGTPAYQDNEYPYIQGSYAVTQDTTKSSAVGSIAYNVGGITVPTDGAVLVWQNYSSPFAFGSYAQGGYRIVLGSGLSDFDVWYVGGNDKGRMPYGGWENHAINPTVTRDNWAGTYSGTINYVGSAVYLVSGPSKGEPHQVDAIRYGRCSAIFEYGETANYCTIAGFATQNDNQSNRWGLIQAIPGGYLWKGRIAIGSVTNAADFRDSNVVIFVDWTPKVTVNFNTIEVINASTNIDWTGFQFIVLDTSTASRGRWITTNDATVALTSCTFNDMYTFVFDSNTTLTSCIFNRCNELTQGGCTITGCTISESDAAVALQVDDLDLVDNIDFVSDGTGHAIELSATGTYDHINITYDGYAATDGSTGNECIYNNSGGAVTINVTGGDTPTIRNGTGASTNVVSGAVTVKATVVTKDGTPIQNALVFIKAKDGTGPFPFEDTVTIANSGTTATVTHTAHGMATNDYVFIDGASLAANNGVFQITVTGVNAYTYTMGSTPGSSPTGTIESTFVALYGLTDALGVKSTSRAYTADQPISGWARKSSTSPYLQEGSITGSVDSADGLTATAVLVADE